jgi:hypothetical protein
LLAAGLILDGLCDTVDPAGLARSDNYYGWAKIAYENLGFMFATGACRPPGRRRHSALARASLSLSTNIHLNVLNNSYYCMCL